MSLEATSPSLGLPSLKDNGGTAAQVSSWKSAVVFRDKSDEWRVAEDEHSETLYTVRHLKLPSLTRQYLWNHTKPDVVVTRGTLDGPTVGSCRIKRKWSLLDIRDTLEFYSDSSGHGTPICRARAEGKKTLLRGMGEEALCWKWWPWSFPHPNWKLVDSNGSTMAEYSSVWGNKKLGRLHWKLFSSSSASSLPQ